MNILQYKIISAAITLALAAGSAHAVLERVGPISTSSSQGGYPSWYQDTTGLTLEFCDPINVAEVEGGWCLLTPDDVPVVPEVFPTSFFDEHFYFAAEAGLTPANDNRARLVLAVEAAFAADVAPGGQITFARIRVRLDTAPVSGTYRFIHPYGEESIEGVAGERITFTDDVGIGDLGAFDGALNSRVGPFLLASNTPGGTEIAAIAGPVPGKLYIADPERIGPVTGSTLPDFRDSTGVMRNHNIFRIEGPAGSDLGGGGVNWIETTDFTLMGRVFSGTMAGRIDVQRATYTRDSSATKLDVFASSDPTAQSRLPGQPRPAIVEPQLSYFDAPCAGATDAEGTVQPPFSAPPGAAEIQMFAADGIHWGQNQPAVLPAAVCVKDASARDASGALTPAFVAHRVSDDVTVTGALFDPSAGTLTVAASSSDTVSPPRLSLAYDKFLGDMTNGQIVVNGLIAPPSRVQVLSSVGGVDEFAVRTGLAGGGTAPPGVPVARNDSFTFDEDAGPQTLTVLANDTIANVNGATITITIISQPRLGTTSVVNGTVSFTPAPNANGSDAFTYTVTVDGQVSNVASVALSINPVNDAPTAVNDSATTIANLPLAINVLANDTDPDGVADLVAAVITTPPAGASASVSGGVVTFTASTAGTYIFDYQAIDSAGIVSANTARVTVQVAAAETINFLRAEFRTLQNRLRATGIIAPAANQTISVAFVDASGTVLGEVGTTTSNGVGRWNLDTRVDLPSGASALKATSSNRTEQIKPLFIRR